MPQPKGLISCAGLVILEPARASAMRGRSAAIVGATYGAAVLSLPMRPSAKVR